jgi:hypothetical protein
MAVVCNLALIPVAEQSKPTVGGSSLVGISGSNSAGRVVSLSFECYVLSDQGI